MTMLSNKVSPPRDRDGLVVRHRLVDAVAGSSTPLVLVVGPAGSGKTVMVRQWLTSTDIPTGWLTVDARDNDPARFWTYVGAAMAAAVPGFDWFFDERAPADSGDALVEQLGAAAPVALVLDDLQFLVDAVVLDGLARLVELVPDDVRLVLVSRSVPDLRLARQRAAGRLLDIRADDLVFTQEETDAVLGRVTAEVAQRVQRSSGGWPVAVAFAARLPDLATDEAVYRRGRTHQQLADYLTEEVLRTQPADVQAFLLDTAILDEITASAADAVRQRDDSRTWLHQLERQELFLTAIDTQGEETWRHHALVRDHLRRTLVRTDPARWSELHTRAATYFVDVDRDRAIAHTMAAPDPELAADLIERGRDDPAGPYSRTPVSQMLRLLEALPDDTIGRRPSLRSLALTYAARTVRPDLVDRWLATRPPGEAPGIEELFAEAWRADQAGDMPRVRRVCLAAIERSEPGDLWWGTMHGGLAGAAYMVGELDEAARAFRVLQTPLRESMSSNVGAQQENLRGFVAVVEAMAGHQTTAQAALEDLRGWLAQAARTGYRSGGIAAWAEAMVAWFGGDLWTANRWDTLPDDSAFGDQPLPPLVFRLDLARVRRTAGDLVAARRLLADVRVRLAAFADAGVVPEWAEQEEAALGGRSAPDAATETPVRRAGVGLVEPLTGREIEVLRLLRSEFSQPEIAAHLYISYNTAKTHTKTIYRKLGVQSRSAAVARARALGYL